MLTHIHPVAPWFASQGAPLFTGPTCPATPGAAKCPEPLCTWTVSRARHDVTHHVSGHYPAFIALTGSCASPQPSRCLGGTLGQWVYAGCCQPLLGEGPSRRYLCASVPACLDPYPGGSCGALTRFFPQDIGLPLVRTGSALHNVRAATSARRPFRGCRRRTLSRSPKGSGKGLTT